MPFDQERRDYLNEKYPSAGHPRSYEKEFRDNTVDRQVDNLMRDALNLKRFNDSKLMVPSDAELRYRANIPATTNANEVIIPREPLSEGLLKRDRPNPTPPTTPPRSTDIPSPGRQVSRAAPPPTPRTSGGAGNILDMTAPPPTAAPRQSMPGPNPTPGSKPSSLPGPPGRLAYPAAGAAIDFAFRLAAGQPLGQAAAGATGSGIGSAVGFAAGATLTGGNPIAAYLGGMIGGYLGGMLGSALYNAAFPPTAEAPVESPKQSPTQFDGGQCVGVNYRIEATIAYENGSQNIIRQGEFYGLNSYRLGKDSAGRFALFVNCKNYGSPTGPGGDVPVGAGFLPFSVVNFKVFRVDGFPDLCGNPAPPPLPKDSRTPDSLQHPGNKEFAPPTAAPPTRIPMGNSLPSGSDNPAPAPNLAPNNYAPGGLSSRTGGTPRGDSPNWIPKANLASQPHPNYSPLPVASLPSISPSGSPASTGAPSAGTTGDPRTSPFTFKPDGSLEIVTPGSPTTTGNPVTNPADRSFPGFQPTILTPNPLTPSNFSASPSLDTATPGALPTTVINQPVPDAYRPTPVVPAPTPTQPSDPTQEFSKLIEDLKKKQEEELAPVLAALVALTALVNPIASNTTPEALENAAATGTCRTLQPGGCSAPMAQNAEDAARLSADNNNKLNALNTTLQGLDLSLLGTINNKLGDQVPGGLSGFLGRLSKSLGVDRALNLIAIASNLHNAMMLSASLKITLLEVLSSVGNATGLLQTSEGDNVDLNAVFNQGIEKFMTLLLGEENYAGLKVGLRKYSAIYRAANNVLNNVGNMFSSIGNGIEVIGERTGKIGNAIRAAGMVRENAYQWMSEKMTVHTNKFMTFQTTVGGVTEVLESINEIAESTIDGQQSYTEAVKATAEFKKVLEEGTKEGAKDAENKAIKEEAEKIKANLVKDPTGEDETGLLSFLTD